MLTPALTKAVPSQGMLYLSGELGFLADGTLAKGIAEQTRATLANISTTLAEHGLDLSDVVSATCYLVDPGDFAEFNAVYAETFRRPYPARTTLAAPLMLPDARIEITVIAKER